MNAMLKLFWQLCLLRLGPDQIPTPGSFVIFVVSANFLISTLVGLTSPFVISPWMAFAMPILHAAVLGSGTWFVLLAKNFQARFTATFTALMGADALITLISWPVALLLSPTMEPDHIDLFLALVQFTLFIWWLTVAGFVFSRALEIRQSRGIAVAVFIVISSLLVNAAVLPHPDVDTPSIKRQTGVDRSPL